MKKIIIFALTLSFLTASCIHASDDFTVTKPYSPGFRDRHSTGYKAALTASFVLGASAAYTQRAQLGNTGYAVLGGTSLIYAHQMMRKPRLLDLLLTNPKAALDHVYAVGDKWEQEKKRTLGSPETIARLTHTFAEQCPIFSLGECRREDEDHCLLSRIYEPRYREIFESHVVTALHNKLQQSPAKPVHYVGFASGRMYQEFVNLAKTLAKKPDAHLDVHFIDVCYGPYVGCRALLGDRNRLVNSHVSIDPTPVMKELKAEARKEHNFKNMTDEKLENKIVDIVRNIETPAQQSIAWLSKTFPNARLQLHLHDTVDNYYQQVASASMPFPDVIATADIDDSGSLSMRSRLHYYQLCARALQANAHTDTIWLGKDYERRVGTINTVTLKEVPESKRVDITLDESEDAPQIPLYITLQPIATSTSFFRRLVRR